MLNSNQIQANTRETSVDTVTRRLSDHLSIRVYSDCRPRCLETAQLQKGLILVLDGQELIEEGMGFGVPVVKYTDKTYFSTTATLSKNTSASTPEVQKTFIIDAISRKKLSNGSYIDDGFYSFIRKFFSKFYLNRKNFSPFLNKVMELRQLARIKTEFVRTKPRGSITVTYRIQSSNIYVKADLSNLALGGCSEVLLLNEQGSSTFKKYIDISGLNLEGNRIGAWDQVAAPQAWLLSQTGHVSFSLQNRGGALLFRGWESTKNRFSWAGLSYMLKPQNGTFDYWIGLKAKPKLTLSPNSAEKRSRNKRTQAVAVSLATELLTGNQTIY
ncbi:MAG: hypothetical protein NWE98_09835 [Candidatus Bathyarchaeota archaeon]|nr:hypothetical protein [Candidatus Bathyarchaeota archaeon]